MSIYRGYSGANREIKRQFRGYGGVNREIREQWRGYSGVNRRVFQSVESLPAIGIWYSTAIGVGSNGYLRYGSDVTILEFKLQHGSTGTNTAFAMRINGPFSAGGNIKLTRNITGATSLDNAFSIYVDGVKKVFDRGSMSGDYTYTITSNCSTIDIELDANSRNSTSYYAYGSISNIAINGNRYRFLL